MFRDTTSASCPHDAGAGFFPTADSKMVDVGLLGPELTAENERTRSLWLLCHEGLEDGRNRPSGSQANHRTQNYFVARVSKKKAYVCLLRRAWMRGYTRAIVADIAKHFLHYEKPCDKLAELTLIVA